jgi:tetratricopeptide (TPR) repeat protein
LCAALWRFWHIRALLPEGRDWTERVLAMDPPPPLSPAVVRARYALGNITYWQHDKVPAETYYRAGIAGAQQLGDSRLEAEGWVNLMYLVSVFPELTTPQEADAIADRIGRMSEELGDPVLAAHVGFARAGRLVADGQLDEAKAKAEATLAVFEASGDVFLAASANNVFGGVALAQGDFAEALRRGQRAAELFDLLGDDIALTLAIRALATIAAKLGNPEAGARLDGYAARLVIDTGVRFSPPFEPEDAMVLARAAVGDERADAAREAGLDLSRDEAMALIHSLGAGA